MAGIYLHVPFCRQACSYCDFHFSTSLQYKNRMVSAMLAEMEMRRDFLDGQTVKTIYFGGGTPSLLDQAELALLLGQIRKLFTVDRAAEITLEANPDDLGREKLGEIKKAGINRLSIGVQSFSDRDLRFMNRAHSAEMAHSCIKNAQALGFDNITIDLIYGIPGQTFDQWKENVGTALSLNVPHISCYCLTIEPKTRFGHLARKGSLIEKDEELVENEFLYLLQQLTDAGFAHYEISNFAKPGYISQHNSAYWFDLPYLGIGPSAHSFDGSRGRYWNISNNALYMKAIEEGWAEREMEKLSDRDRANEYVMTRLRTQWGINREDFVERFGRPALKALEKAMEKFFTLNWLSQGDAITLTEKGKLKCDYITRELFIIDE